MIHEFLWIMLLFLLVLLFLFPCPTVYPHSLQPLTWSANCKDAANDESQLYLHIRWIVYLFLYFRGLPIGSYWQQASR